MNLTINPEFKNLIPALQEDEYRLLEDSLIEDGCRDPLIVWNNTLIDGHNRYELCKKHGIDFAIKEKFFESEDEAKLWIIKNQLGRRNLSDHDRRIMIGLIYKAEKKAPGGTGSNQHTVQLSEKSTAAQGGTARKIASEFDISRDTVLNSENYLDGFEKIKEIDPAEAKKIEQGKSKLTKTKIQNLRKAEPEEVKEVIEDTYLPKTKVMTRTIVISDEDRLKSPEEEQFEKAADAFISALQITKDRRNSFNSTNKVSKIYKNLIQIVNECEDLIDYILR